jgi:hypothetical protein
VGSNGEEQNGWSLVSEGKTNPCFCPHGKQNSRKKDKLLCSQLQVVNFLQTFLAQEDTEQSPDALASEDASRE